MPGCCRRDPGEDVQKEPDQKVRIRENLDLIGLDVEGGHSAMLVRLSVIVDQQAGLPRYTSPEDHDMLRGLDSLWMASNIDVDRIVVLANTKRVLY